MKKITRMTINVEWIKSRNLTNINRWSILSKK